MSTNIFMMDSVYRKAVRMWGGGVFRRGDLLIWHEIFIKKTKILKCFPIFLDFQNHFLKHKIIAPFSRRQNRIY